MQSRELAVEPRSPLEALLARTDDAALDYVTDQLLDDGPLDAPPPAVLASTDRTGTEMDEAQVAAG